MPVADYHAYCRMIDHARAKKFAYPAINVTSPTTANGVLKGLAESKSDGIIQVSTGGAAFASGLHLKDMPLGAITIAEHVHRAAERYPIYSDNKPYDRRLSKQLNIHLPNGFLVNPIISNKKKPKHR